MVNNIKVGDTLVPDPLWNQTERGGNRLAVPSKILGVQSAICQSGILLNVRTVGGQDRWLDAGWFVR